MEKKICLAGCVILDSQGKVLLIHRNTPERVQWELPGGKIEEDENSQDAAVREVEEELGIKVRITKRIGEKSFEENGFEMDYIWFLAEIIEGQLVVKEMKHDAFEYFSWEELEKMRSQISPNTKNLLGFYQENNKV